MTMSSIFHFIHTSHLIVTHLLAYRRTQATCTHRHNEKLTTSCSGGRLSLLVSFSFSALFEFFHQLLFLLRFSFMKNSTRSSTTGDRKRTIAVLRHSLKGETNCAPEACTRTRPIVPYHLGWLIITAAADPTSRAA